MPTGQPDPITMHAESLARSRLEAEQTIIRLRALFGQIIEAMQGLTDDGFPMELAIVDFKDPVGNAAWREHTREQGKGPLGMPLMPTEDELVEGWISS